MVKNISFKFFTFVAIIAVILPNLIQDGMFMDGMIYSTVAMNLANGEGTFWDLHLTSTLLDHFREQPPLTIWITSFFFKIFGNSMYTERIYSFTCAIIGALMIRSIWKKLFLNTLKQELWWLPVLLFFITPITFWSYQNNVQENTMMIFSLVAFNFYLTALLHNKDVVKNCFIAGVFLTLAVMSKGIQGSFPILTPLAFWLVFRTINFSKAVKYLLISLSVILLTTVIFYFYSPAREYFHGYYMARIHNTFNNPKSSTTQFRFFLLYRLISELLVSLGLIIFVYLLQFKSKNISGINSFEKKSIAFLLLIGLSGTLPLMVTLEQRSCYLLTALPFFILAVSIFFSNQVLTFSEKINGRIFRYVNYFLFATVLVITISRIGHIRKHKELLTDIHVVGKIVPPNSILTVSKTEEMNWSLYLYFKRYYNIDIIFTPSYYFMKSNSDNYSSVDQFDQYRSVRLNGFELYTKKK